MNVPTPAVKTSGTSDVHFAKTEAPLVIKTPELNTAAEFTGTALLVKTHKTSQF